MLLHPGHITPRGGLTGEIFTLGGDEGEEAESLPFALPDLELSRPCEMERHARCCGFIVPMESDSDGLIDCDCHCHIFQNS